MTEHTDQQTDSSRGNPRITLNESDIERLKQNGHLHRYTDDPSTTVTLEFEE